MGVQVMQLLILGCCGWMFYHLMRALEQRELAALLQITCYALAAANVIQIILTAWDQINQSPVVKLITKIGGN